MGKVTKLDRRVQLVVDEALDERLRKQAQKEDRTVSSIVRRALVRELNRGGCE